MINQPMHIYKYVQSHVIILNQHVSVTFVTIIRVFYYNIYVYIQIIVQKYIYPTFYVL